MTCIIKFYPQIFLVEACLLNKHVKQKQNHFLLTKSSSSF